MERIPSIDDLDSDFKFLDLSDKPKKTPDGPNNLKPKDRVFLARLGALALAAAITTTAGVGFKNHTQKDHQENKKTYDASLDDVVTFDPDIEIIRVTPVMTKEPAMIKTTIPDFKEEAKIAATVPDLFQQPEEEHVIEELIPDIAPVAEDLQVEEDKLELGTDLKWKKAVLNAYDGHVDGPTGDETYYNLPMDGIVARMHRMGFEGDYWVRDDGVKMLGDYVMVAANLKKHPRGSIVETSLGTGVVCDTGAFAEEHPERLDIATNW